MDSQAIFGLQFLMSVLVWSAVAKWLGSPWLDGMSRRHALSWLTLPHAIRHMGMVFLVPGVVAEPLPASFANPAAYGDLLSGFLALLAFVALRTGVSFAMPLVWVFNVVGTVDLVNALRHFDVAPSLGAAWYIPTLLVPLLLVTHFMIFVRLLRGNRSTE